MPQIHTESINLYALFVKVRKKLSESTAAFWTDLEVYSALNEGQKHIVRKSKCLTKEVTVTTIVSTPTYNLRDNSFADIIDISEDGVSFYQGGTTYSPLTFKTKKQLNTEFPGWQGVTASVPSYYYYNKASKTIGLYPKPNASNAGAYLLVDGVYLPKTLNAGTASAGSSSTITLAAGSSTVPYPSTVDDYYNGLYMEIYSGTGAGERAKITDYAGSTGICTVDFTTTPDDTSVYGMVPEIPEDAHYLMALYAIADLWEKAGSRSKLSDRFWQQYYNGLGLFIEETNEDSDELLIKDTYR